MITDQDMPHLRRCIELAKEALDAGDEPFGSVLVDAEAQVCYEDRNRINSKEATYHPEIAVARWAAQNMSAQARRDATVYTSGEHCPMCAAAHAWAGLGRIVYVSSSAQLAQWLKDWGIAGSGSPVTTLPINAIAPDIPVEGPVAKLDEEVRHLHDTFHHNL